MIAILMLILAVISAYLIGSFPTSFILTKALKGIDIRDVGSKNAGATNVLRAAGKIPALITLIIDMLKGVLVVTVVTGFFYSFDEFFIYDFYRGLLAVSVVCGHIWSAFLKFKGGKGVATTLGVGIAVAPLGLLPSLVIWLAIFMVTQYVSLASIISLIFFPIVITLLNYSCYTILASVIICGIVIYKHKDNIARLLKGEENRVKISKS